MRIDLSGRTALVTGSTAGIGFAIASGLAESGATVLVNGRTEQRVHEAIDRIRQQHPDAELQPAVADVGTADGVATLVDAFPRVDVLVNNAGVFEQAPFGKITDDDWQQVWDVNVMSGIRLSRAYVDGMVEAGWGRIVFISSESALHIPAEMVHYGVTKTAQLAVARGMAESYPGTGVTINSVLPGPTRSEGVSQMLESMASGEDKSPDEAERDFIANERPTSLIQRLATPEEVANMVVYVCSPQASATTGAALRVDGGVVRAIP
jgi:NAD(P)-dependent dehydrogenase (short-subunit alcohol dehydrogenase family)